MNRKRTQTHKNQTITIVSMIIAVFAVMYAISAHRAMQMTAYAVKNGCTWYYNGTVYGDNRDYTCK